MAGHIIDETLDNRILRNLTTTAAAGCLPKWHNSVHSEVYFSSGDHYCSIALGEIYFSSRVAMLT